MVTPTCLDGYQVQHLRAFRYTYRANSKTPETWHFFTWIGQVSDLCFDSEPRLRFRKPHRPWDSN